MWSSLDSDQDGIPDQAPFIPAIAPVSKKVQSAFVIQSAAITSEQRLRDLLYQSLDADQDGKPDPVVGSASVTNYNNNPIKRVSYVAILDPLSPGYYQRTQDLLYQSLDADQDGKPDTVLFQRKKPIALFSFRYP